MAYDSLREVMEALCILNGYKVLSHICLGVLVKTLVGDFPIHDFERFRYARNSINYYGKKVELQQGKALIDKMFQTRDVILAALKQNYL